MIDPNAWLSELRTLLQNAPDDPQTREVALDYAQGYLGEERAVWLAQERRLANLEVRWTKLVLTLNQMPGDVDGLWQHVSLEMYNHIACEGQDGQE